ncbi:LamG-like jellyroll fold domain-containing protein, partial [Candidatus Margulisiibacteriota bacterium]
MMYNKIKIMLMIIIISTIVVVTGQVLFAADVVDQQCVFTVEYGLGADYMYQTFTAGLTRNLTAIAYLLVNSQVWNYRMSLYAGDATGGGGTPLATKDFQSIWNANGTIVTFDTPVAITSGLTYTFKIEKLDAFPIYAAACNNLYASGYASVPGYGTGYDLWFKTYVEPPDADGDGEPDATDAFPYDARLQSVPAKSVNNLPVASDLLVWLDGSEPHGTLSSNLANNEELKTWIDFSGNDKHAIQNGASTAKPAYKTNIINSKSVVYFYNDELMLINPVADYTSHTLFVVTTFPKGALGASGSWNTLTRGNGADHQIIIDVDAGGAPLGTYVNSQGGWHDSGVDTSGYSGTKLITAVGNGSDNTKYYIDGQYAGSIAYTSVSDIYCIGNYQGGDQPWGYIAELIVYNRALSRSEIEDVSLYLAEKWDMDSDGATAADVFPFDPALTTMPSKNDTAPVTSGLVLWLDGSEPHGVSTSVLSDNEALQTWVDFSGQGNHFFQNYDPNQPTFQEDDQNSNAVINFNGSSQYFESLFDDISSLNPSNLTVLAVSRVTGGTGLYRSPITSRDNSPNSGYMLYASDGNIWEFWTGDGSGLNDTGSEPVEIGETISIMGMTQGGGSIFTNNVQKTSTGFSFTPNSEFPARVGAGMTESTPGYHFYGDIMEVMVFNKALLSLDRNAIHDYLVNKWNIDTDADGVPDNKDHYPSSATQVIDIPTALNMSGLQLWLDASAEKSGRAILEKNSSDQVSMWYDLSGQQHHVSQSTTAKQPVYNSNPINDLATLTFNGTSTLMSRSHFLLDLGASTIFVVLKAPAQTDKRFIAETKIVGTSVTFLGYGSGTTGSTDKFRQYLRNDAGSPLVNTIGSKVLFDDKARILSYTDSGSNINSFVNIEADITSLAYTRSGTIAPDLFTVGGATYEAGDISLLDGDIAEIIIYDSVLNATQREQVEDYLIEKWDLDLDFDGVPHDKDNYPTDDTKVMDLPSELDIGNLKFWLDVSATKNGTLLIEKDASNNVSTWYDLSGNQLHVSQSVAGYKPIYADNSINFDGIDDRLEQTSISYGLINQYATIFVVCNPASNRGIILDQSFGHGGYERGWNLHRGDDDYATIPANSVVWNSHDSTTAVNANHAMYAWSAQDTSPINTIQVIKVVKNGAVLDMAVNNADIPMVDDTVYASTIDYVSGYTLNVGRKVFGPDYLGWMPYQGEIQEIILFDKLVSATEQRDIEEYLAKKWDLDEDGVRGRDVFPFDEKLKEVPPKSDNLPVTQNLAIWLDGSEPHGVSTSVNLSDNDTLMTWVDYSGNSRHVDQKGSTQRPIYNTSALNGKSVLRFDGTDDYLVIPDQDITDYMEGGVTVSVFTVFKQTAAADTFVFCWQYSSASNRLGTHLGHSNGNSYFDIGNDSTARVSFPTPSGFLGQYQMATFLRKEVADVEIYNKSSLMGSRSDASGSASGTDGFYIGSYYGTGYYFNGDLAELIIYKEALSESEIAEVETYLSNKWNIAINELVWDGDAPENETVSAGDNWDTGGQPGSDCNVIINSTSDWIDWDSSAATTVNSIELSGSFTGALFVLDELYVSTNITVNAGSLVVDGGTLTVPTINSTGGGTLQIDTGTLKVRKVELDLENTGGILAPGLSAGITQISGNYTQGPTATLNMELGGTSQNDPVEYDQLHVSGNIDLDGTLEIVLIDSFVPTLNDSFDLMDWDGTITNNFNAILLPTLNSGLGWDLSDLYDNGIIKVIRSPGGLSGLALWVAADDRGAVSVTDNNKVRNMIDKSGSGVNMFQDTSSYRPLYQLNSQNNKAALRFDAVDDNLIGGANYIYSDSDGLCIFAVHKSDPEKSGTSYVYDFGSRAGQGYGFKFCTTLIDAYTPTDFGGGLSSDATTSYSSDKFYVTAFNIKFNDIQKFYVNQEEKLSVSIPGLNQITAAELYEAPTRQFNQGPVCIGSQSKEANDSARFFDGEIAEVIVFTRALTKAEKETIEEYLASKWDVDDDTADTEDVFPFDPKLQEVPAKSDSLPVTENLALWLDGFEPHGVSTNTTLTNNETIQSWVDFSGNGYHFDQETTAKQPTYISNAQNGKSILRFNASQYLLNSLPVDAQTVLAVVYLNETGNSHRTFLGCRSDYGTTVDSYYYKANDTAGRILSMMKYSTTHAEPVTTKISNEYYLYTAILDTATRTNELYVNESLADTAVGSGTKLSIDGPTVVGAGYYNDGIVDIMLGDIAELIVYNRKINSSEREELENYLEEKWNLDVDRDGVPYDKDVYPTDDAKVIDLPSELGIGNLKLWLDASAAKSGTPIMEKDATENVSKWYDLSGNKYHISQDTANRRPTYNAGYQNSKPVIGFDGSGSHPDYLFYSGTLLSTGSTLHTIIAVAALDVFSGAQQPFFGQYASVGDTNHYLHINGTSTTNAMIIYDEYPPGGGYLTSPTGLMDTNTFYIFTALVNSGASTKRSIYLNNIYRAGDGSLESYSGGSIVATAVGARYGQPGSHRLNGNIAELIVFDDAITDAERQDIEEYLAEKWDIDYDNSGDTDVFPFDPKLEKVPAKSDSLPVTQNLAIWLDGSEPHGVSTSVNLSDNDPLMTWVDYSGNSRHVDQKGSTKRPIYNTSALNGKSVLRFDGIDDYLVIPDQDITDYMEGGVTVSIFTVFKQNSAANVTLFNWEYNGITNRLGTHLAYANGISYFDMGSASTARLAFTTPSNFTGQYQIATFLRKEVADIEIYNRSSLIGSKSDATGSASGTAGFYIGSGYDVGYNFPGDLAELIIYKEALTGSEILQVETYLSNKWGITINKLVWDSQGGDDNTSTGENWDTGGQPDSDCTVIVNSTADNISWD